MGRTLFMITIGFLLLLNGGNLFGQNEKMLGRWVSKYVNSCTLREKSFQLESFDPHIKYKDTISFFEFEKNGDLFFFQSVLVFTSYPDPLITDSQGNDSCFSYYVGKWTYEKGRLSLFFFWDLDSVIGAESLNQTEKGLYQNLMRYINEFEIYKYKVQSDQSGVLRLELLDHQIVKECEAYLYTNWSVQVDDVLVSFERGDSKINVRIKKGNFERVYDEISFPCDLGYMPGIPRPTWSNDKYVGFTAGCGTSCFGTYLAPLNHKDTVEYGGDFLIDTLNTIFFTILFDDNMNRILKVENFNTHQNQEFKLDSKDFWSAIPFEHFDFEQPHPEGFTYENHILTIYFTRENETQVRSKKFKIEL